MVVPAGTYVVSQGDDSDSIYLLHEGTCRVLKARDVCGQE